MAARRWYRLSAPLAVVAALTTAPAVSATPAVALAGNTVVTAGRTGSIAVRLARAVDVSIQDLTVVAPRGRLAALILKKDGAWNAPLAQVVHEGYCASAGCVSPFPKAGIGFVWAPGSDGTRGRLPAGTYRLYVVTDGAPVTFTLRLKGLAGSLRLTPRDRARAAVVAPKPTMAEPASSPALFAGGSTHTTPKSGGIHAVNVWKELPATVPPSAVGLCSYQGAPPAGSAPAYQMPCADGNGGFPPFLSSVNAAGTPTTPVGPGRFVSGIGGGYLLPPGTWSIGGYHDTTGPVTAAYVHQLWLDF